MSHANRGLSEKVGTGSKGKGPSVIRQENRSTVSLRENKGSQIIAVSGEMEAAIAENQKQLKWEWLCAEFLPTEVPC